MVNAGKELAHVASQHIAETARKLLGAVERFVRAFADAVGVGVENKRPLKNWFDQIAQRMVYHAVAEGRGGDEAFLGVVDVETVILPRLVSLFL